MRIDLHPSYKKSYRKCIASDNKLAQKTKDRIRMFMQNPSHPLLRDHELKGKLYPKRAFSVTGDIRIIYYQISADEVLFIDIGTHNQVY